MSTTDAHAAHAQETTLANRYGVGQPRAGRRRLRIVLGAIAFVAAVALAVTIALTQSAGRVESKDVGYRVHDAGRVTVTFQVALPAGVEAAECDLAAMDEQYAPVGFRTVRVAPSPGTGPGVAQVYDADVRTVVRAVTGVVDACRPA